MEISSSFPAIAYDEGQKYTIVPAKYIARSSVSGNCDKILFIRREVKDLFQMLKDEVMEESCVRHILGPPGVGKSLATFAFACTLLDPFHVVTWIFLTQQMEPSFVRFIDGKKRSGHVESVEWLKRFLIDPECEDKIHLVVLDGYTDDDPSHRCYPPACNAWVLQDMKHRRHVSVYSMSSSKKLHPCSIEQLKLSQYLIGSWTKDQYREALQSSAFLNQVKDKLDAHVTVSGGIIDHEQLMESKFFFSGGSCRYMFDYSTQAVIEDIDYNLERCGDLFPYLSGTIGACSNGAVDHLLCSSSREKSNFIPVSEYAATAIAKKLGPNLISNLRTILKSAMNPSMDGHLFEMWFFAKLEHGKLEFKSKWAEHKQWWTLNRWSHCVWDQSTVVPFDPEGNLPPICTFTNTWLKPLKWNQGGYDAVFLQPNIKSVTFVQLTRSDTHSFKPKYFKALLENMKKNWRLDFQFLDICFAVPSFCAHGFSVQRPSDPNEVGLFEQYFVHSDRQRKWNRHQELTCTRICSIVEH